MSTLWLPEKVAATKLIVCTVGGDDDGDGSGAAGGDGDGDGGGGDAGGGDDDNDGDNVDEDSFKGRKHIPSRPRQLRSSFPCSPWTSGRYLMFIF